MSARQHPLVLIGMALALVCSFEPCYGQALLAAQTELEPYGALMDAQAGGNAESLQVIAPLFVRISVNGLLRPDTLVLRGGAGRWFVTADDLIAWTLRLPAGPSDQQYQGLEFYALDALPGYRANFDGSAQALDLEFSAEAFLGGTRTLAAAALRPTGKPGYGGFLNYDFLLTALQGKARSSRPIFSGLLESVFYTPFGRLQSSFVGQDLTAGSARNGNGGRDLSRLETSWTTDLPSQRATLTLGDASGVSGLLGRPQRFMGLRYGTNFATTPGFLTSPTLQFDGNSTAPSVVELFINGQRSRQATVPAGPFSIQDIPLISGQGEAQLVVTDVLGRQQIINQSFLTSARLLRQGLLDFSFEIGRLRKQGGGADPRYGQDIAVGQGRYGVNAKTTGELRLEASEQIQNASFGAVAATPLGVITAATAASQAEAGRGWQTLLGLERQFAGRISVSAQGQWSSRDYQQLTGSDKPQAAPVRQWSASLGLPLGNWANLAVGFAASAPREISTATGRAEPSRVATVSLSRSLRDLFISVNASRQTGLSQSTNAFVSVGYRFGGKLSSNATAQVNDSVGNTTSRARLSINSSLGSDELGSSYRTELGGVSNSATGSELEYKVGAGLATGVGSYEIEAARQAEITAARASARGALGFIEGAGFASRTVTSSFARIHEPALAGLPVFVNSQKSAVLDANGDAILPRLTAFAENTVRVDLSNADYSISLPANEVKFVPAARTGHLIQLLAQKLFSAMLRLVTGSNNLPVAPGSVVQVSGADEPFYVAEDGLVFITSREAKPEVRVRAPFGLSCVIPVDLSQSTPDLQIMGPYLCAKP